MKNRIILFLLVLCLTIPSSVYAEASIRDVVLFGPTQRKKVGEEVPVEFNIRFSGIEKGSDKTLGIWRVIYEINFDSNVFAVTKIDSPGWNSIVFQLDGKYYVYS